MQTWYESYRDILQDEFGQRRSVNAAYSLRAYARDLGLSPSRLSEVMSNKGGPSLATAEKLAKALKFSHVEVHYFKALVTKEHGRSEAEKREAKVLIENFESSRQYRQLNQQLFHVISDWYYFAIMTVMELDEFDGSEKWIAQRLGLTLELVENAVKKLIQVGMVERKSRRLRCLDQDICTTSDIEAQALKISHKQTLDQVKAAIDDVPVEKRDITSTTMAIDAAKIPEAKKRIKKFRRELAKFLESGKKNSVYNLNVQLHPLTIDEERKP